MKFQAKFQFKKELELLLKSDIVWWSISLSRSYQFEFETEFKTEF